MGVMLLPRQYYDNCNYYSYYGNDCYSGWNSYGRWIFLGCIIALAILLFFLFSCITARRRRRMGYSPYRGTGWALGRAPAGHGQANYNPQSYYNNSNNPPPAYQSENAGYYGNGQNNNNVELQQPQTAYKPPQGPPPGR